MNQYIEPVVAGSSPAAPTKLPVLRLMPRAYLGRAVLKFTALHLQLCFTRGLS